MKSIVMAMLMPLFFVSVLVGGVFLLAKLGVTMSWNGLKMRLRRLMDVNSEKPVTH
jgi:hypothetical protein